MPILGDLQSIQPIFIVGSPRSGTTAVMGALAEVGTGYVPHVEGHMMSWLLEGVDKLIKDSSPQSLPFLPTSICHGNNFQKLLEWLARCIDGFEREIAGGIETGRWIDKTPDIYQVRVLPTLQRIFPLGHTIFTYRNPLDVVFSISNVWPGAAPLENLLRHWTELHREYRQTIRPLLDLRRVVEIKQEDIVSDPARVSEDLRRLLGLGEEEKRRIARYFAEVRVNRSSTKSKDDFSYHDQAGATSIAMADQLCGEEMSFWGYSLKDRIKNVSGSSTKKVQALLREEIHGLHCWCACEELSSFSTDYFKCSNCGSLVSRGIVSGPVESGEGMDNYLDPGLKPNVSRSIQSGSSGDPVLFAAGPLSIPPSFSEQARQDLSSRCAVALQVLLSYKLAPQSTLDVGVPYGVLTALLNWSGFKATGLEDSRERAKRGSEEFGVRMLVRRFEDPPRDGGSFDAIVITDVVERYPDPVTALGYYLDLLKPDGVLLIQTAADIGGLTYEEMLRTGDTSLHQFKKEINLHLFCQRSVALMLERLGCPWFQFQIGMPHKLCVVASRVPQIRKTSDEIIESLSASKFGWLVLALLNSKRELEESRRALQIQVSTRQKDVQTLEGIIRARDEELASVKPVLKARDEELASIKPVLSARERELARVKEALLRRQKKMKGKLPSPNASKQ